MSAFFDYKLFGLEPRDIAVYETLVRLDRATSIRLLAEQTRLNRGTTYEVIKKLVQIGLVGAHYKNKRKYYAAQSPDALVAYAKNINEQMNQQLPLINRYVTDLTRQHSTTPSGQFTQFYDGEEEIATLLRDVLSTTVNLPQKEYRVISSAEIRNLLYKKFTNFTKQRIKQGISARVIAIGHGGEPAALAERRWLSSALVPECYLIIYGHKVAQISLSELGNIQGVVVQNKGISQLQQLVFDALWDSLALPE